MSTTIDKLSIEIESSSNGAAQGIEDLAKALGKLKGNGAVGVAVKNITALKSALNGFSVNNEAVNSVGRLAGHLEKLKNVGSIKSIGTSLSSLSSGLKSLDGINIDNIAPQLEKIAAAVTPLSGVKAGGLGTMVNGLAKLRDVTNSLDNKTIEAFTAKVKQLSAALTPLSDKMTTVKQAFSSINSMSRKTSSNFTTSADGINKMSLNMSNFIAVAQAAIQVLQRLVEKLAEFISQAIEWDGISARFGRGFGDGAQETYEWILRLNKEMGINVQQFMQYSSVFATMLQGFGVNTADAGKMALGYTELIYDIWAGYNDVYKNFGDAAEAVKSAIAGEVEPIRRAGFTIVEATLEQTAANHGLSISLEKATEAEKSYLRYLTLVDQAHAQNLVGTYAKELNTAEGLMRTFSQQLKTLAQSIGSLFLPILVKVMPYVQAFVDLLKEGVQLIASFFGIEIQFADFSNYGNSLGGIADTTDKLAESNNGLADSSKKAAKAAEDLKRATIGIDELNIISPPKDTSAGSGSGGSGSGLGAGGGAGFGSLPVDSLWDESIFDNIKSKVDEIKKKFKELFPVIAGIAAAFAGWSLMQFADSIDETNGNLKKLKKTIKGIGKVLAVAGITVAVGKLVWDFTGAYLEGVDKNGLLKAIGTTVLGTALAGFLAGEMGAGIVLTTSGIIKLTRLWVELKEGSVKISDPAALKTLIVGAFETVLGGALIIDAIRGGAWVKGLGTALKGGLETALIKGLYGIDWLKKFITPLATSISGALGSLGATLAGMSGWTMAAIAAIVGALILGIVDYDFSEIGYKLGYALGKALRSTGAWLSSVGTAIKEGLNSAFNWLINNFSPDSIWELIHMIVSPFTYIATKLFEIGKEILPGLWNGIKSWWSNLKSNISEFISGFIDGWKDGFKISSPSKVFEEIGGWLIEGLWNGITGWFNKLVTNISTFVTDTINKVKTFFGISGNTASSFKEIGGNLVQGIIDGITGKASELWGSLKSWADGVISSVKGFFGIHSPSTVAKKEIGDNLIAGILKSFNANALIAPLKTMWNTAKSWWSSNVKDLGFNVNIGSIKSKLASAWSSAKTWWNKSKGKLSDYTPNIGSIKSKLYNAWVTAKNWWNKSKGNLSYTPKIGSFTNALKSAWNTAKSWWNKNVKLSIPSLSLKVSYSNPSGTLKKAVVKALGLSGWPSLKFAANGGMFDQGSLVWAGERGAEIVANAHGGKTGVMNVEQMQQAVYEGVLAAMVASQRGAGGGNEVHVYLDGREITATVEKRQKERGVSIMGSQVYRYG